MIHHLTKKDKFIDKIISKTFPEYKGRKIKICTTIPTRLNSYWEGGSRNFYCFYEIDTEKTFSVNSNHPYFEKDSPRQLSKLPSNVLLVSHVIFCGKDMGITIYVNPSDIDPLLTYNDTPEITEHQKIVLEYTASLKSSYAKIKNLRFYVANKDKKITLEQWNKAKEELIENKFLNKNGAINAHGRNLLNKLRN